MKDMKKSKFIVLLLLFCLQPGFLAAQRAEAHSQGCVKSALR